MIIKVNHRVKDTDIVCEQKWQAMPVLIHSAHRGKNPDVISPSSLLPAPPPIAASPREALLSPRVRLPLCMAQGRIAAQTACPCPPAIPAIMPGERITPECADLLAQSGILEIEVVK